MTQIKWYSSSAAGSGSDSMVVVVTAVVTGAGAADFLCHPIPVTFPHVVLDPSSLVHLHIVWRLPCCTVFAALAICLCVAGCVPQGGVQGVSRLFTLNNISIKMDCHDLILSYGGHRFCHKFIALSLPCTVTFVDKEEGQLSMAFVIPKNFLAPSLLNMFGSPFGEEGQPRCGIQMRVHDQYRLAQSRSAKQKSKRKALQ